MPRLPSALWWLIPGTALLSSCRPERVEVGDSWRTQFRDEPEPRAGLTDQHRFAENTAQQLLSWKTPDGWHFVAATEFRHINFTFGPDRKGECYLTVVTGEGGGLPDNFTRWRKQLGRPEITEQEAGALPTKMVLGRPAPFMDITAPFDPAKDIKEPSDPKTLQRLVGTIFQAPGALFTIKMTGPSELVEQNLKAYDDFLASIAPGDVEGLR